MVQGRDTHATRPDHSVTRGPRVQAVHLVQATESDWSVLAERGATAALCPRSNASLLVGEAPVGMAARTGIPVGLGTDSSASGGNLDLFEEARAALSIGTSQGLEPETVLRWITYDAARSLGIDDRAGALSPGRPADLAAFRIPPERIEDNPACTLLETGGRATAELVMTGGRVHRIVVTLPEGLGT